MYIVKITYIILNHLGHHHNLKCEFPDEDHLNYCNLVNCHMKYSGYRGFFSTSNKKCVQIPECQSKNNSDQVNK